MNGSQPLWLRVALLCRRVAKELIETNASGTVSGSRLLETDRLATLRSSSPSRRGRSMPYAGTETGFEDSLSDEARVLCCRALRSASQARRAPQEVIGKGGTIYPLSKTSFLPKGFIHFNARINLLKDSP